MPDTGVYAETIAYNVEQYNNTTRDAAEKTCHTVHTSVYDIENGTLSVIPQEGGFSYDFDLNGRIG